MAFEVVRIASSGLFAAQKALEIVSNNIANADNANYTRQSIDLGSIQESSDSPGGVHVLGVDRLRNIFADATWRSEASVNGATTAEHDILAKAEGAMGTLSNGLTTLTDDFFRSWSQLSLAPNDTAAREGVIGAATSLSADFRRLNASIDTQRLDAATYADRLIGEVNTLLEDASRLNNAILESKNVASSHNDLLDQRDKIFDKLATLVGARVHFGANGDPEIQIGGYTSLVGTTHTTFELRGTGLGATPFTLGVVGAGDVTVTGGTIGGVFTGLNVDLPDLVTRIDAAAIALRDQVNAVATAGFDRAGNPGTAVFTGATAGTLVVNVALGVDQVAASATALGAPGDGNNALVMAQLQQDLSATSAMSQIRAYALHLGSRVDETKRNAAISEAVLEGTTGTRQASIGVNIDEEMVDLVRFQRAFQASAKAVSIADEVLDTLINRMLR